MSTDKSPPSTHLLGLRPSELRHHGFGFVVVDGPDKGKRTSIESGELTVGRAEGNRLVLTDPAVSQHHLSVSTSPDGFLLVDVGSSNGTRLAAHRVREAFVEDGSLVEIGMTSLRFEESDDEVREPLSDDDAFGEVLGRSVAMRRLFSVLPSIAESEATVLLEGETGTGKGLFARAIHGASARKDGPLLVLDCGAIPPGLIENELFGHEKGAFTGAHQRHLGLFEAAAGGTLFLDEVGELPLDFQPKLLRALEERTVRRVGGVEELELDVRIIAATNKRLRESVNRGAFRSDLYYRLNVVNLHIPPLRERRDDVPVLIEHFFRAITGEQRVPEDLIDQLADLDWPGNVRELRSAVERFALMRDPKIWALLSRTEHADATVDSGASPYVFDEEATFRSAKAAAIASWERWYVAELIRRHDNNLSAAARATDMDRNHLRDLMRRHGIERL